MLAASWPESIREPEEVLLVDRVQHRDGRPLDDLVFQGGNRERPLPTVRFGYVDSPGRQRPICSSLEPRAQVHDVAIEALLVGSPRQSIYAGCGILLEFEESLFEVFRIDVMQERGELLLLPLPCRLATCRTRSSACDTFSRSCARRVLCCSAFPLASALCSANSSAGCPASFIGFSATMVESGFPCPCVIGYGSSPSRCGPARYPVTGQTRDLPVPVQRVSTHARFFDHAGPSGTRARAPVRIAFHLRNSVGTRDMNLYGAQWLACVFAYRPFAVDLTGGHARLGG